MIKSKQPMFNNNKQVPDLLRHAEMQKRHDREVIQKLNQNFQESERQRKELLMRKTSESEIYKKKLNEYREELQKKHWQIEALNKKVVDISEELSKKQSLVVSLNKKVEVVDYTRREELHKKQCQIDDLSNKFKEADHTRREELYKKQCQIENLNKKLNEVQTNNKLELGQVEREELKKKQHVIENLNKMLRDAERNHHEELKKKQDEIAKLKKDVADLKNKRDEIDLLKGKSEEVEFKKREELSMKQDEIQKLADELKEAKHKRHRDVMKKQEEIDKLKNSHREELRVLMNKNRREMANEDAELEAKKKEVKGLEDELKIYEFTRSAYFAGSSTMDFYYTMIQNMQKDLPPLKIRFTYITTEADTWPPSVEKLLPLIPLSRVSSVSSIPEYRFICQPSHQSNQEFDQENWRVLRFAFPSMKSVNVKRRIMAYYDNEHGHTEVLKNGSDRIVVPIPCSSQHIVNYSPLTIYDIMGVGIRLAISWVDHEISGDNE